MGRCNKGTGERKIAPRKEVAGAKPATTNIDPEAGYYLLQRRNDRPETHFLSKAMRGLHLLVVEGFDERASSGNKPVDGRAVERNLYDTPADAAHQSVIRITLLTAREFAQRSFDRCPMTLLRGSEMQRALDARNIDRRGMRRCGIGWR